jgi:imidazolonepropionase-like amidohydrolase
MSLTGHQRVQALVGATVIDGRGGMPIRRGVILVEDSCVAKVGTESTVPVPREATVIDLDGFFVLPGLIDCHIHLSGRRTMDTRGEVFTSPGLMTARAVADARTLLSHDKRSAARQRHHHGISPRSTPSDCPVMLSAKSEARNR